MAPLFLNEKKEGRHNTLEYAIQLKNVTKTFGKVVANKKCKP